MENPDRSPKASWKRDEVVFEMGEHCIETTARRLHRRLVDELLQDPRPGPELEGAVELLRVFLEQEDFGAIRASHPGLAGGHRARIRVYCDAQGAIRWARLDVDGPANSVPGQVPPPKRGA